MATNPTEAAKNVLEECLNELESSKGSVLTGVQKLSRAASILQDEDVYIWCQIQLGNYEYTKPLEYYYSALLAVVDEKSEDKKAKLYKTFQKKQDEIEKLNLKRDVHFGAEDLTIKTNDAGGGFLKYWIH